TPYHMAVEDDGSVVWAHNGTDVYFANGELKGLMEMRDVEIQYYIDELERFTQTLVTEFNQLHRQGFNLNGVDGIDLFAPGSSAEDITLDDAILDSINGLNNIAASLTGEVGNGENALRLAR